MVGLNKIKLIDFEIDWMKNYELEVRIEKKWWEYSAQLCAASQKHNSFFSTAVEFIFQVLS